MRAGCPDTEQTPVKKNARRTGQGNAKRFIKQISPSIILPLRRIFFTDKTRFCHIPTFSQNKNVLSGFSPERKTGKLRLRKRQTSGLSGQIRKPLRKKRTTFRGKAVAFCGENARFSTESLRLHPFYKAF